MIPVSLRIVLKFGIFLFSLSFILFFVFFGFRYNSNIKKIEPQNLYINFKFRSASEKINFDGQDYFSSNGDLTFYNLASRCYKANFQGQENRYCGQNGQIIKDTFVNFVNIKKPKLFFCQKSESFASDWNFGENILFSQKYKNIVFVFTKDKILNCSDMGTNCKFLTSYQGNFGCFTKQGIIINSGENLLYELK